MVLDNKISQLVNKLWELLEPVVRSEGMELVELEYRRESQGWVLRLFVDQSEGISVDDCAKVSSVVGDLLDVIDLIPNAYHLEVSSPGLNRPLRKPEHFKDQVGRVIELKTGEPVHNRRKFKGVLVEALPEEIKIDCQGELYTIPLTLMERARLCYFDSLGKSR